MNIRSLFNPAALAIVALFVGHYLFTSCSSTSTEEVEIPTQGLITTVREVSADQFKIEDETTISDTSQSLIIAKYLNGNIDTFTLAEARLVSQTNQSGTGGSIMRAAGAGLFGYMIGRSLAGGFRPSASAYVDPNTYNRVNNTTGNQFRSSTTRVSRPSSSSRSGYGSGRTSRSVGG